MAVLLILFGLAFYASGAPQAATAPQPNSEIFGRVVDAETREAVRRAAIKVFTSKDQWDQITDGEGRFRFSGLARGEYGLAVHRDGYTDRAYTVERSDFDQQKELPIELHPQGLITGRAADSLGQPLQGAQIQALSARTRGGEIDVVNSTVTNDLGEYRLSGLDPGTYRLRAVYHEGRTSEFDPTPVTGATTYYGSSEKPTEIAIKAGAVLAGIDFTLSPVRPATIRGTLHAENHVFTEPATLWIMGTAGEGGHNDTGRDGKFAIGDVGPGTYTVSAETLGTTAPLFGIATVQVRGDDVDGVDLVLQPIPKLNGEVRVEGSVPAGLKLGSIFFVRADRVTLNPMQIGRPDENQNFTVALIPGEYTLSFDESINKFGVQRVTLNGKTITNWKLQIDRTPETKNLVITVGSQPRK